jgi:hypothetical protein
MLPKRQTHKKRSTQILRLEQLEDRILLATDLHAFLEDFVTDTYVCPGKPPAAPDPPTQPKPAPVVLPTQDPAIVDKDVALAADRVDGILTGDVVEDVAGTFVARRPNDAAFALSMNWIDRCEFKGDFELEMLRTIAREKNDG